MQYVGIQAQQSRNNMRSLLLLCLFPCLVLGLLFLFCYLLIYISLSDSESSADAISYAMEIFLYSAPYVTGGVLIWFLIAYFANTLIIKSATGSRSLSRKENKRIYNLVENLCMTLGMQMPKINIIEDGSLNAFASGINKRTYTVTLTRGLIDKLDDDELEAVIAHELSHIRNHDVRLLIISIVFVGIFAMVAEIAMRMAYYSSRSSRRNSKDNNGAGVLILVAIVAAIGFFFSSLMRFAISRKREYSADAGAAEMTKNPLALANALRKISMDPDIESIKRDDIAQLFIEHPTDSSGLFGSFRKLFATHPPIEERIRVLEQF